MKNLFRTNTMFYLFLCLHYCLYLISLEFSNFMNFFSLAYEVLILKGLPQIFDGVCLKVEQKKIM
jgi:hypothetical protein